MRNPLFRDWRAMYGRPFTPKPYRIPYASTPGLDALSAWLRKLREALKDIA